MTGADGDHLLVAKLDDVHVITTMLKTINFKEQLILRERLKPQLKHQNHIQIQKINCVALEYKKKKIDVWGT